MKRFVGFGFGSGSGIVPCGKEEQEKRHRHCKVIYYAYHELSVFFVLEISRGDSLTHGVIASPLSNAITIY